MTTYEYNDSGLSPGEWAKTATKHGFCDLVYWEHEQDGSERGPLAENFLEDDARAIVQLKPALCQLWTALMKEADLDSSGLLWNANDRTISVPEDGYRVSAYALDIIATLLASGVVKKREGK